MGSNHLTKGPNPLIRKESRKSHDEYARLNLWFFKSCYRSLSKFKAFCVSLKQFNNK